MFSLTAHQIKQATSKEGLIPSHRFETMSELLAAITRMNRMYNLPVSTGASLTNERTEAFTRVVQKEVAEAEDVLEAVVTWRHAQVEAVQYEEQLGAKHPDTLEAYKLARECYIDALVAQADWLNDIIVYCLSEQVKLGLDPAICLSVIMASNFTKLGADGLPIKDADGKVCKGPNFKKPEPTLRAIIAAEIALQRGDSLCTTI